MASGATHNKLAFVTHWTDPLSGVQWTFSTFVYPSTSEIELIDTKNRRAFLRRSYVEGLPVHTIRVGSKFSVFGRQLDVVDYGDVFTKKALEQRQQRTLGLIKPDAYCAVGDIMQTAGDNGFTISKAEMFHLSEDGAYAFCTLSGHDLDREHQGKHLSSGPVICLELIGPSAVHAWLALIGPRDPQVAKHESPSCLRARFGSDPIKNACYGSASEEAARKEIAFFFEKDRPAITGRQEGSTLGLVKPHVIADGVMGKIVTMIMQQFTVLNLRLLVLSKTHASEFLEVYRGVLPPCETASMIDELSAGPLLALEINSGPEEICVESFRQLCGPADPDVAKILRPQSIRALYGKDKKRNAVHCTDLEEDGQLELEYIFELASRA